MKNFDNLFNDFFGNEENQKPNKLSEMINGLKKTISEKEAKKLIDIIKGLSEESGDEDVDTLNERLEIKLGKPDEIEYSKDGEMFFEKRMWYKEHGIIVKTLMSSEPFLPEEKISLEEQLVLAIEIENYELAAELRDSIKKAKAKEKRREKKLKKIADNQQIKK